MIYEIRTADASDLSVLTELYLTYCVELQKHGLQYEINVEEVPMVLNTRIKSRLYFIGLAQRAEKTEGFIICSIAKIGREYLCEGKGQIGYINDIYVKPTLRHSGCASQLFAAAKAWLRESGVNSLRLEVLSNNIYGKFFWEKVGGYETATLYQIKF